MWKRLLPALLPLIALVAVPLLLRTRGDAAAPKSGADCDTLVIVTPHPESIKQEFETAFREHYRKNYGREVVFDWRNVGGTSDIVRYIDDRYTAAFRQIWEKKGKEWTSQLEKDFKNSRLSPEQSEVRKAFLESDTGIGIDLFFGGGTYDQSNFGYIGYGVDAGVRERHPEYLKDIPQVFAGETIYDEQGRYYGLCLSSFGIAYNIDRFTDMNLPPPSQWKDLTDPRLFQKIAIADPTKSGSITKCYEMIIQQAMSEHPDNLNAGWQEGFSRVRLIAANSRYATDSAGALVRDVSAGSAAAGMCIDFYCFSEAQCTAALSGRERIRYVMPENGSAVTADPIQMLRGAPNRKTAEAFVDFMLSEDGQKIWMQKAGTPGGPVKNALLRPCVRTSLYEKTPREYLNYPDYNPYHAAGTFVYRGAWTGRYFGLIRVLIKCIALDPMDELREAWQTIQEHGGPEACPEAVKTLCALPFSFDGAGKAASELKASPREAARVRRSWTEFASEQYKKAAELAAEGR